MAAPVPRRRIVIEFEPGLEQVAGTISIPPEPEREFCGWLELISRLDVEFSGRRERLATGERSAEQPRSG
jgi:hypothetical protein